MMVVLLCELLKTTGLFTLSGWIVWCVNGISIKLVKINICIYVAKMLTCSPRVRSRPQLGPAHPVGHPEILLTLP